MLKEASNTFTRPVAEKSFEIWQGLAIQMLNPSLTKSATAHIESGHTETSWKWNTYQTPKPLIFSLECLGILVLLGTKLAGCSLTCILSNMRTKKIFWAYLLPNLFLIWFAFQLRSHWHNGRRTVWNGSYFYSPGLNKYLTVASERDKNAWV